MRSELRVAFSRWVLCGVLLLAACGERASAPLQQDVYIWQRQWQAQHAAALTQSHADFARLRVLAGQQHPRSGWSAARVDLPLLAHDGRPVIAVVRLDGQLPQLDVDAVEAHIAELVRSWRGAKVQLRGVEIDHDCGAARLGGYARFLQSVRAALASELSLSITALPSWLAAPELDAVLAAVDSSVLQVHAVERSQDGLMDSAQALRWIDSYSKLQHAFYVSLPAYGMALVEADGRMRVESEVTLPAAGTRHELSADPAAIRVFMHELRERAPPGLQGVVWFRLPLPDDRRAWPLATLLAVARDDSLGAQLQLNLRQRGVLHDLTLANIGNVGSALPQLIEVPASECTVADGVGNYRVEVTANQLVLRRTSTAQLPAGRELAVGWARCRTINKGTMRVTQ